MSKPDKPTLFYADPVDEDGNVIATARMTIKPNPWIGDAVKIPHSELALEGLPTIHAKMPEPEPDDA